MTSGDRMTRPSPVERVLRFIRDPGSDRFEAVALDVFAFQYEQNEPYRRLCESRGAAPTTVKTWEDVPAVPAAAFKLAVLACGPARRVFRTSGTTGGEAVRGKHYLPELGLYEASWGEPFRRGMLPDRERIRMLSLVPPGETAPESSLSWMIDRAMARFGAPGSAGFATAEGLDLARLRRALAEARERGEPVCILGTVFSTVAVLDALAEAGERMGLPPGSRVMDTGGYKGRSREVARDELLRLYEEYLGIPPSHVVGEFGMTEMCSQLYEATLARAHAGEEPRRVYVPPPWVRTRVLDPDTLRPVPDGEPGLLAHFDLANAWTVASLVTEDLGVAEDGGVRILGRAEGAELRGCSLATEDLLGGSP